MRARWRPRGAARMRSVVARRILLFLLAAGLLAPLAAGAQSRAPRVDIVEIPGTIDRPIARYLEERIRASQRERAALVLLQMDSAGFVKITAGDDATAGLVDLVADSPVPVAVWAGPRDARIASGAMLLLEAAHVAAMTPSSRIGPLHPVDLAHPDRLAPQDEERVLRDLAGRRGRTVRSVPLAESIPASAASRAGLVDLVAPTASEVLERVNGRTVQTRAGPVTLSLPADATDVSFHQPGPIRRALHTLANPALAYLLLVSAAMLIVFEMSQPGFGVAGATAALFVAGATFGLTVLPVRGWALGAVVAGLALLGYDVAVHGLGIPTVAGMAAFTAGSLYLFPGAAGTLGIPAWLAALGAFSALVFFVPVMTVIRRGRRTVAERAGRHLIGEPGQVRSVLNPEGFVWVAEALWRARSAAGERIRVGEDVVVVEIEGAVLHVRRPDQALS